MIGFVFLLLVGFIGLLGVAASIVMKKPGPSDGYKRWPFAVVGLLLMLISGVALIFSSVVQIGPSDVGIVTAFGHTVGTDLGPGIHSKAPWETVTTWDDSVQQTAFEGGSSKNIAAGCLDIRIAGQQSACLDVIVFWKDKASASDTQFRQFRTFDRVKAAYFSRGVITKFYNSVFEKYDPIALAGLGNTSTGTQVSALTKQVLANMQAAYANVADVVSLNSGQIQFTGTVENALNREVAAKTNANVALLNKQASVYQAQAAANLQRGGNLSALVVAQNCLNVTQTIIQGGSGNLPPNWTCLGSSGGVIVSGK